MGCASIPEALSVLLKNISNEKSIIRVLDEDLPKLQQIMSEKGFRDLAFVVHYILDKAQDEVKLKTVTIDSIMESNVPCVLTSPPKTGKTTFCKKLIDSPLLVGTPILVVDVNDECVELNDIGYSFYNIDFEKYNEHVRFLPNPYSSEKSVEDLFEYLDRVKNSLKRLIIIVEEAEAFIDMGCFVKFFGSARHHTRKMICATPLSKGDSFQGIDVLSIVTAMLPVPKRE